MSYNASALNKSYVVGVSTAVSRKLDVKCVHLLLQWCGFTSHIHIGMFLSGQHVWVANHSFFELRCHYSYRAARSDLECQRTHMCLTLHQEDKNRPFLHAPRGHEVAYGLLMSPHINLRFNSESPKRRDATTSDLRGETLHCINPPWTGLHPRCRPFLHYY